METGESVPFGPATQLAGAGIKAAREGAGLSLRDLAAQLTKHGHPLSASALQRMEVAHRRIDLDDVEAIAEVLEVSAWTIQSGGPIVGGSDDTSLWDYLDYIRLTRLEARFKAAARQSADEEASLEAARQRGDTSFEFGKSD